jgi:hypothetical protein
MAAWAGKNWQTREAAEDATSQAFIKASVYNHRSGPAWYGN